MSVKVKAILAVVFLLVLEGVFLRYTLLNPEGEKPIDPTEQLRIDQMTKLQEQQKEIQDLYQKLHQQQQTLLQEQQKHHQFQEDSKKQEDAMKMFLAKKEEDERLQQEMSLSSQISDTEWESSKAIDAHDWPPTVVIEWARRVCDLDRHELARMLKMKLTGTDLLKQTKSDFLLAGFPLGPATKLSESVNNLLRDLGLLALTKVETNRPRKRSPKIAVIGSGFSGIATTREIAENGGIPILIEESRKPGGIWIYDSDPKTVSGYYSLYAQGAASDINIRGWVIPPDAPRVMSIHQITDHLTKFWNHFGLSKYAVYNTHVTNVQPLWEKNKALPQNWMEPMVYSDVVDKNGERNVLPQLRVHYKRTEIEEKFVDHDETYTGPDGNPSTRTSKALMNITKIVDGHYDVDGVVICVGRNHIPVLPRKEPSGGMHYIPGLVDFTGRSIHSSEYRLPTEFSNTTVIVSGGGKSGQDIAQDLLTNPTLQVFHSSNNIGSRNRILNITKEEDGTFTVYFQKGTKGEDRAQPVKNVGGIIWCWGFQWIELPVDGTYNVGTFYNDVLYKNYPGVTRVGTQGVLASSRAQAVYVARVLTGRIPVPNITTPEWTMVSNWNGVGREQYLWHELTTY